MYIGIINNETNGGLTMIVITKLIMIGIAIVCLVTLAFVVQDFVTDKVKNTSSKNTNRVHFYVARDKNGELWLYIGKPIRGIAEFRGVMDKNMLALTRNLKRFGLNKDDFKELKWEDEPLEVFLNMED